MAVLISKADGNLTDANGWNSIETGTSASQTTRNNSTTTTTSYVYSSAFTGTNLNVCDGLLLYCNQTTTTGTVSVTLSDDNGVTATREVTVNATDLQTSPGWVFFKFGSTLTLDGGTDYKVGIKGSSAGNATFFRDATAGNWTRRLRLTATATAAAGDVLYIVGEHTGAGATTTRTITMDSTATTDYGTGSDGTADNGIEIGDAGILQYGVTASTAYYLKLSGSLNVWANGTLNIGTSGSKMPSTSSAVLEFDPVGDGGMGLIANNGAIVNMYGNPLTTVSALLAADAASSATSLTTDSSTGWLNGDVLAIASTTRTASQTESKALTANASGTTLTIAAITNAHSGTSPTQAEIVNLTRNVKMRSATSTLATFFVMKATATINCEYVEYRYLGLNATDKRGIDIQTTTGSSSIKWCSIYDSRSYGIFISGSASNNFTIQSNVLYNVATVSGGGLHLNAATSGTAYTIDSNIIMLVTNGTGVQQNDVGGTWTNNTLVGVNVSNDAWQINESNTVGTWSGNTIHSNGAKGINIATTTFDNTLTGGTIWRNNSNGMVFALNTSHFNVNLTNFTAFGNSGSNFRIEGNIGSGVWTNCLSNGDSTFSTTSAFELANNTNPVVANLYLDNCNFSTAGGIKTACTVDIECSTGRAFAQIVLRDTILAAATEVARNTNLKYGSYVGAESKDQTAGSHKSWMREGTITIDTTAGLFNTASPSERLTPASASNKLQSGVKKIAVASGATLTPAVYVRESVVGDGTDYNGNRVRLIVKANPALGIDSDTTLATATIASEGAFEQISGTTAAVSDDGVLEFVVDCDGTTGWVNVDDWSVS